MNTVSLDIPQLLAYRGLTVQNRLGLHAPFICGFVNSINIPSFSCHI